MTESGARPDLVFEESRPRLTRLAYQMTGSMTEAEDVVQEAYLRWETASRAEIRAPAAWLTTVVSRLCLDHHKSARVRREEYVGPWLPEPVLTEPGATPFDEVELAESVSMALLRLLQQLTPAERAAFVLHEAFDYPYEEIGEILGRTPAGCRQLARRARQRLAQDRPRFRPDREEHRRLLERFVAASATGEVDPLLELLAADVTLWSDGGGRVLAARNPIVGADKVARFLVGVRDMQPPGQTYEMREVNGEVGFVGYVAGRPRFTTTFDVREGRIHGIYIVLNPDKLSAIPQQNP